MLALLFPGQGSQYIGMCRQLADEDPQAAAVFAEAGEALGLDLLKLIDSGPFERLSSSAYAQPAVVAAGYALAGAYERLAGAPPDCAAGHSLGEITALAAAGAITLADAVRYASRRGELMHRAVLENRGRAGIVVDMDQAVLVQAAAQVREQEYVAVSGYNSPRQFIVAGTAAGMKLLEDPVDAAGGELIPFRMIPMKADAPYHSMLMAFVQEELDSLVAEIPLRRPRFPVWSTVTGGLLESEDRIRKALSGQLVRPVLWNQALAALKDRGVRLWVDAGPGRTVRNLVMENPALGRAYAFDEPEERRELIARFAADPDPANVRI
ncbi:ACP S-malonyltransferase [Saccharibacillus sp. CPCC 101409]|uniref:ACP S-malonyltransferase n=1 Tax=Saccharibacillus sp. CPCC 101409 TaxID=3058041 RepID=UPI002671E557|nr:ACP S-malonyltransferase [Saccharibacillus sp. CPCC 101409]MDO3410496.1 ACP S-malonyltransferase [Saccharibacillus sp. CPCC 101409]